MSVPNSCPEAPVLRPASQLQSRPVSWLWPGRLALGKLAILDGDPELGKSLVTLDLCARLSTGRPWPDDQPGPPPGNAIVLNGEDAGEDTLRPRLHALGADLERVFLLSPLGPDLTPTLSLPRHTAALEEALARTQARLLIVDPIMACLDQSINTAHDPSMRRALVPLASLADRYSCAVLLVRHLNKSGARRALYRGLSSIGLVAACRSAWLLAPHPRKDGRRVLAQVKNNLGPRQTSLTFEVRSSENGLPLVSWLGLVDATADELLTEACRAKPRDLAREFLLEALHEGAKTCQELWQQGKKEGLHPRTIQRAGDLLEIKRVRYRDGDRTITYWALPDQPLPPEVQAKLDDDPLEAFLQDMRERYPPPNPLEDSEV